MPRTMTKMLYFFYHLQEWRSHNVCGQPVPFFSHPHSKKTNNRSIFLCSCGTSCVSVCAHCPVTRHYWREPGSVFFEPSLQVFKYIDKIPPKPSLLQVKSHILLNLSPQKLCSGALTILVALHWSLSSSSRSLLYWVAQKWIQYSREGLKSIE